MNRLAVTFLAIGTLMLSSFAAPKERAAIELRHLSVEEAYAALQEELGREAAEAVGSLDLRSNALKLDPEHAQAAKVREFLARIDVRQPQVVVNAVITRQVEATETAEAYEEVLSRPTSVVREGRRVVFEVAGQGEKTKIELLIQTTPGGNK